MEPEDIIQHKSWQELSAAEKAIVAPLAASEEDYILMQRILREAGSDEENMPVLQPGVPQHLLDAVHANQRKVVPFKRYFIAAAAVFIVAAGAWWVVQTMDRNDSTITAREVTVPAPASSGDTTPSITPPAGNYEVSFDEPVTGRTEDVVMQAPKEKEKIQEPPVAAPAQQEEADNERKDAVVVTSSEKEKSILQDAAVSAEISKPATLKFDDLASKKTNVSAGAGTVKPVRVKDDPSLLQYITEVY